MDCREQNEQEMLANCKKYLFPKVFRDVFVLTYDRMRKYKGAWHLERHPLFPGHIILESGEDGILSADSEKCGMTSVLWNHMVRIGSKEEGVLRGLCGEAHHLEMSRGVIRKGNTRITEGPLKGKEGQICGIDRHKRLARIEIGIRPDCRFILAGLEITEKTV